MCTFKANRTGALEGDFPVSLDRLDEGDGVDIVKELSPILPGEVGASPQGLACQLVEVLGGHFGHLREPHTTGCEVRHLATINSEVLLNID